MEKILATSVFSISDNVYNVIDLDIFYANLRNFSRYLLCKS